MYYNKKENKYNYRAYDDVYAKAYDKKHGLIPDRFLTEEKGFSFEYITWIPDSIICQMYKISEDSVFRNRGILQKGLECDEELAKAEFIELMDKFMETM